MENIDSLYISQNNFIFHVVNHVSIPKGIIRQSPLPRLFSLIFPRQSANRALTPSFFNYTTMKPLPFIINRPISHRVRMRQDQFQKKVKRAVFALCFFELLNFVGLGISLNILSQPDERNYLRESVFNGTLVTFLASFGLFLLQLFMFPTMLKFQPKLAPIKGFLWKTALLRFGLYALSFAMSMTAILSGQNESVWPVFIATAACFWNFMAAVGELTCGYILWLTVQCLSGTLELRNLIKDHFDDSIIYFEDLTEEEKDLYSEIKYEKVYQ